VTASVLVVDDDGSIGRTLKRTLAAEGRRRHLMFMAAS